MILRSFDTEGTGLDIKFGARPFLFTFCDDAEQLTPYYWEFDVDPLTRQPVVTVADLEEIQRCLDEADVLVLQNAKYDCASMSALYADHGLKLRWDWSKVRDTLISAHMLASNQPKDLTTQAVVYLNANISPLEEELQKVVNECRRLARSQFPEWRIAKRGLEDMPSAKDKTWKYDMWLPRALAKQLDYPPEHPWYSACSAYANGDSVVTLPIYLEHMRLIEGRKLGAIYREQLKKVRIAYTMEQTGVTLSSARLEKLEKEFSTFAEECRVKCVNLADGEIENLPVNGRSKALDHVVFNKFKLASTKKSKRTGNDSMDKDVLDHWLATLPERSKAYHFIKNLRDYRSRKTALSYMTGYRSYWVPLGVYNELGQQLWYRLHPSLNSTGTDTLRWSSSNPNEQNISKKGILTSDPCPKCEGTGEAKDGRDCSACDGTGKLAMNIRYAFGPAPGREWWSCDAKNIELRIPAYASGERELIDLFERPDEPPYYGSTHLLNFHTVYDDIWARELAEVGFEKVGPHCKKKYNDTWYQWCKNGGFAVQYGAVEREQGTADRAFHRPGSHAKLKSRFARLEQLNQKCIAFAERHGYVETIPDRTVDPNRGYPLLCSRTKWGGIKPTVPLNYYVQGSAMDWMIGAMIRIQDYLDDLNSRDPRGFFMVMQVHDELVFDFPKGRTREPSQENRPKMRKIQHLMEQGGENFVIRIPTPTSCSYHPESWAHGEDV